ncbi:hypothetical protein E1265_29645 [Streptomyces sp. 8K308]|uniref:hypothetical protein n=1 Tax=Streptomyces sp. 8K308 TaxID=2530388 RepID=UPI001045A2EA|nr:hypothetical protein [Streptomyces sp. 8K308]TDC12564.1 hypothetical protein E1265_29645 [Streptomyces sp. 8K308]
MAGTVDFTRADVEAALGRSPWRRRDAFTDEIDPESMAGTAAAYARAAAEAGEAGELAEAATRAGEEAGRLNGEAVVDGTERIDATARGLQGNGADLDRVTGLLVRAMNRALDAVDEVNALIDGPTGLDAYHTDQLEQARRELASTPLLEAGGYGGYGDDALPGSGAGGALSRPALIRLRHLTAVVDRARATSREMGEAIAQYRRRLAEYGTELDDLDYDVVDGPLGLWTTSGMARFAADGISRELASGRPDPEALRRHTETLAAIGRQLYDPLTGRPLSGARLDDGQLAYLEGFYARLDARELAALGDLAGGPLALDPARRAPLTDALTRVADGLVMLTDPAVGGAQDRLPAAALAYLGANDEPELPPRDTAGLGRERFEDFGRLMDAAAHRPSAELERELRTQRAVVALWAVDEAGGAEREAALRDAFAEMDPGSRASFWSAHRESLTDAGLLSAPPDRRYDEGAGPYDVAEPLVRDYALQAELEAGATVAEAFGYEDAAQLLDHYLDGSGSRLDVDVDGMLQDSTVVGRAVDAAVSARRDEWTREATEAFRESGGRPVAFPVRSGAQGFEFDDANWRLAMGHAELDVAGVVTVEPGPTGRPEARLDYQVNVWDRYNWDDDKVAKIGWMTFDNADIGRLHSTGLAQDYDVRGRSSVRHTPLPVD